MALTLTERLELIPITAQHVPDLVAIHAGPDVAYWYGGPWSEDHARDWAEGMAADWAQQGAGKWLARRREDGELVGRGGLSWTTLLNFPPLGGGRCLELGWALREEHRGQGYATELGRAGLDFAFGSVGVDAVYAYTEVHNLASRAVMERLGMSEVGEVRGPGLVAGRDDVVDDAPFVVYRSQAPD